MNRSLAHVVLAMVGALAAMPHLTAQPGGDDRVILVTLDGARTEEIFGGLDLAILESTVKAPARAQDTASYQKFWAPTPEERRARLMPFFWTLVQDEGSIAGDARLGSVVRVANQHWFSYPGYAELLLGEPHDAEIKSNDPIRNPFTTVFEEIQHRLSLPRERVATFASWSVFNEIVEHREGTTFINAGVEPLEGSDSDITLLNGLQRTIVTPWDGTRFDSFTFQLAMKHIASARPRALYLALDETDDWAHDGRYDRVLDSYRRTDDLLRELWTWVQSQPDYRGKTHLLITTDHGRGHTVRDWRDHGAKVAGADQVWMAWVSPRMTQRGVWKAHAPLSSSQVAATLAGWMGIDWRALHPAAGAPIR